MKAETHAKRRPRKPREPSPMELARLYGTSPALAMQAYRRGEKPKQADWPVVYVFTLSDGSTKVGYSTQPVGRVAEVGVESKAICRAYWAVRSPKALEIERVFHRCHRDGPKFMRSEYYPMQPSEGVASIKDIIRENGFETAPDPSFGDLR